MPNPDNVEQVPPSAPEDIAERSTNFWFGDGSIVLQVERMLFRVHGGVLSVHSSVFRDMFALPQPSDQPTVDGCVIVLLQDASKDWENLLLWIYHHERIPPDNLPVSVLASVLRLAKKYQLDAMRDNVVAHLKTHIPANGIEWDEMKSSDRDWITGKEFNLINLAEEFCINTLLPALYCLAMIESAYYMEDISEGQENVDGMSHLSLAHQRTLAIGVARFQKLILMDLCDMQGRIAPQCPSSHTCSQATTYIMTDYIHALAGAHIGFAFSFKQSDTEIQQTGRLCPLCREMVESEMNKLRERWWDSLPEFFCGGKNWKQLVDFED